VSRVLSPVKILGALVVFFALTVANGCIYTQERAVSDRPVTASMDIYVQSNVQMHTMNTIGVFPFTSPPEMEAYVGQAGSFYQAQLVQKKPFREVKSLPYAVKNDSEALWYGRSEGCDLVMIPSILYLIDGTGAMPTRLEVRTRILDARTGRVLWDVKQSAFSEPGPDVDLFWNTVSGKPARRYTELASTLAGGFANYLIQQLIEEEKKQKKGELLPVFCVQ